MIVDCKTEINLDDFAPIEPLDKNHIPSLIKASKFLDLLSAAEVSFEYLQKEFTREIELNDLILDADGIIIGNKRASENLEKMKPLNDCEIFITQHPFNIWDLITLIAQSNELNVSEKARLAAMAKLANDPKQLALKNIEQEYESQKTQFKRRGFTMQFVREMASKYPVITSQKTIENLVAKLNKENEHIPR